MTYSLDSLGFALFPVKTRDGSRICRLETPFLLAEAFPFDIFVEETPLGFHVFDEGLTYHNLLSLGLNVGEGKRLKSIRSVVGKASDVRFSDQCMLEALGPVEAAPRLVAGYIASLIRLDQWVFSVFAKQSSVVNRVPAAMMYFRQWKPEAVIREKVSVEGFSGKTVAFDFAVDDEYVDVLSHAGNASGSFLRKVAETRVAGAPVVRTLGVIDDTEDRVQAEHELEVVSVLSPAMLLTQLEQNARNSPCFTASA